MAKRLSEKQKQEIVESFTLGTTINELSKIYNFSILTITRNLKKYIGEDKYKELSRNIKLDKISNSTKYKKNNDIFKDKLISDSPLGDSSKGRDVSELSNEEKVHLSQFTEIDPINFELDNITQKDLSSIPLCDVTFPKIVYMIVDKHIELEIKLLKNYPEWQFLSQEELDRKTIQIFYDLKIAKRFCNNEKKVIKVPNTNVFNIVAPLLVSKGITRIVSDDLLISL